MDNKIYYVLLGGAILVILGLINTMVNFLPSFIVPFVAVIYGLSILFMSR